MNLNQFLIINFYFILLFSLHKCELVQNYHASFKSNKNFSNYCTNDVISNRIKLANSVIVQDEKQKLTMSKMIYSNMEAANLNLKLLFNIFVKNIEKFTHNQDVSKSCQATLGEIINGIKNGDQWALAFIKTQPFYVNNLLTTIKFPMVDYQACLNIKSSNKLNKKLIIRAKYCPIDLISMINKLNNSIGSNQNDFNITIKQFGLDQIKFKDLIEYSSFKWVSKLDLLGICLPIYCNSSEISLVLNRAIYQFIKVNDTIKIQDDCYYHGKVARYDFAQKICVSIIFVFIVCVIISTYLHLKMDANQPGSNDLTHRILLCFSAKKTIENLIMVRQNNQFKAKDGIGGIFGYLDSSDHTFLLTIVFQMNFLNKYKSMDEVYKYRQDIYYNYIDIESTTLFTGISLFIEQQRNLKNQKFNYLSFIVKRYLRFLPIILTNILISIIFEHFGDGPNWNSVRQFTTVSCEKNWFVSFTMMMNFLYFYPGWDDYSFFVESCNSSHWYNSVAFQLCLVSPLVFLPLIRAPKFGIKLLIMLILISNSIQLIMWQITNVQHMLELYLDVNIDKYYKIYAYSYWPTWNFFYSFLFGILVGYLVKHKPNIYLGGKLGEFVITILSVSISIAVVVWRYDYGSKVEFFTKYHIDQIYILFHKPLYLLGYSWIIYACATGRLATLNRILGCRVLSFTNNLRAELFTLNVFILAYNFGTLRHAIQFNDLTMITYCLRDFIMTYILAIIVCIFISRPIARIINEIKNYLSL